jgi:chromosome segregation protein
MAREIELRSEQLKKEIYSISEQQEQVRSQLAKNTQEIETAEARLKILELDLPAKEVELQGCRRTLAELEKTQTNEQWQQIQQKIKDRQAELDRQSVLLRAAEDRFKDIENQQQRLLEKIQECQQQIEAYEAQQSQQQTQLAEVRSQESGVRSQIAESQDKLRQLEEKLGEGKKERDRAEQTLREQHLQQQQLEWELQKLQETQANRRQELEGIQTELQAHRVELPDPLPALPERIEMRDLVVLQEQMRSLQKRLQAMEPVNMLALEEYDRTTTRLAELSEKLGTIAAERTELLLRIENFTTLRFQAFKEAFDAVNENFQTIFAELSDGDGYLQLEDAEDPFNGGLNLVAHPKGKPVQRLASMSGGEKSLTALSFIFALQRYRPSPFYAFDEVDMFLDGANVERLARMIEKQARQAQFIVVSLRRPMIESSERTIGVTQARGAYTQVLGLKLQPAKASV